MLLPVLVWRVRRSTTSPFRCCNRTRRKSQFRYLTEEIVVECDVTWTNVDLLLTFNVDNSTVEPRDLN